MVSSEFDSSRVCMNGKGNHPGGEEPSGTGGGGGGGGGGGVEGAEKGCLIKWMADSGPLVLPGSL